jgi:hypothetical protein
LTNSFRIFTKATRQISTICVTRGWIHAAVQVQAIRMDDAHDCDILGLKQLPQVLKHGLCIFPV